MPRLLLHAAALGLLFYPAALRAKQSSSAPSPERVAGTVVSDTDSHPLPHATVTLTALDGERLAASTTADDEGHYVFGSVPPAKYRIVGSAPHYLSAAYLQHDQYSTAIVTGAGLPTGALELRLVPSAGITGRVVDNGEPVPNASVSLYREDLTATERISPANGAQTDSSGDFQFPSLAPGKYYLSATAVPWYAVHPQLDRPGANYAFRPAIDPELDVAYPTTFYPDALDSAAALPLAVTPGAQLTIDLQMHPQHAVTLTVRDIPGEKGNERFPQVTQTIFGQETPLPSQMDAGEGIRRITGLPPGHYNVQEISNTGMPMRTAPLDLSAGSATLEPAPAIALANVSVTLHMAGGGPLPPETQLSLIAVLSSRAAIPQRSEKGAIDFLSIPPGAYRFGLEGANGPANVISLTVNGKPVPDHLLHVAGGGDLSVELKLSNTNFQVEGFARRAGKAAPATMVILVPAGADTGPELFRRDQSDLDGSFTFSNVTPGNYIVVAIEDAWSLRWTDIPTLAPYLLHGMPLSIPSRGPATVHLPDPITPQLR